VSTKTRGTLLRAKGPRGAIQSGDDHNTTGGGGASLQVGRFIERRGLESKNDSRRLSTRNRLPETLPGRTDLYIARSGETGESSIKGSERQLFGGGSTSYHGIEAAEKKKGSRQLQKGEGNISTRKKSTY